MSKVRKTREELSAMLMEKVREHEACSHVVGASITHSAEHNWGVAWTVVGNHPVCPAAYQIEKELQALYDLEE
ncbi:MAG TPA: hypothetical protein VMF67_04910 [Rhizomicrobium sp.]|nr:hypothetical protein [Rhizomicrobium sp.]